MTTAAELADLADWGSPQGQPAPSQAPGLLGGDWTNTAPAPVPQLGEWVQQVDDPKVLSISAVVDVINAATSADRAIEAVQLFDWIADSVTSERRFCWIGGDTVGPKVLLCAEDDKNDAFRSPEILYFFGGESLGAAPAVLQKLASVIPGWCEDRRIAEIVCCCRTQADSDRFQSLAENLDFPGLWQMRSVGQFFAWSRHDVRS